MTLKFLTIFSRWKKLKKLTTSLKVVERVKAMEELKDVLTDNEEESDFALCRRYKKVLLQ